MFDYSITIDRSECKKGEPGGRVVSLILIDFDGVEILRYKNGKTVANRAIDRSTFANCKAIMNDIIKEQRYTPFPLFD